MVMAPSIYRVINELEEVDTLAVGSVVRTDNGFIMEKLTDGWYMPVIQAKYEPNMFWLPARVLWDSALMARDADGQEHGVPLRSFDEGRVTYQVHLFNALALTRPEFIKLSTLVDWAIALDKQGVTAPDITAQSRNSEGATYSEGHRYSVDLMLDAEDDEVVSAYPYGGETARLIDEAEGGVVAYGHINYLNNLAAHLEACPAPTGTIESRNSEAQTGSFPHWSGRYVIASMSGNGIVPLTWVDSYKSYIYTPAKGMRSLTEDEAGAVFRQFTNERVDAVGGSWQIWFIENGEVQMYRASYHFDTHGGQS